MAWATTTQVSDITGTTVTTAQLNAASSVIDIYANRTEAASGGIHTRDLNTLKQACAWQAVWQAQQTDYGTKSSFISMTQDGFSVTYGSDKSESEIMLAPLARRALRNLSWKGSKSTKPRRIEYRTGSLVSSNLRNESSDELFGWR